MNYKQLDKIIQSQIKQILQTRDDGQKEYARDINNVFANFQRVGEYVDISQEQVLMVYLLKHIDGIMAYINGHKSQREGVEGRITDAIVYLLLLKGMVDDNVINK
jgi:hypothetical protein